MRTEIIEEEFQISDFQVVDIGLEDYLDDQHISAILFAEWIKAASLDLAGTLQEPEAENNSYSDTEDDLLDVMCIDTLKTKAFVTV